MLASVGTRSFSFYIYIIFRTFYCYCTSIDLMARELSLFLLRLRDWRKASDIVEHMDPSFSLISVGLLNQLLYFLGKSGKIENMIKVSGAMFDDLLNCPV